MDYVDDLDFTLYPELTAEYLFRYVSEEEIFAKYLGIPIDMVNTSDDLRNPLRDDKKPGCSFYYGNDNRLRFTDFAGYTSSGKFKSWDCFDCAVAVINMTEKVGVPFTDKLGNRMMAYIFLDISPTGGTLKLEEGGRVYSRSKLSFSILLKHIAQQFKVHVYSGATDAKQLAFVKADKTVRAKKNVFTTLNGNFRDWNKYDVNYWSKYHADLRLPTHRAIFKLFGINPLHEGYINGKLIYTYKKNDPCYSYYEGKDEQGRIHAKFYFPKRDGKEKYKPKFYCNTKRLQGFDVMNPSRFGILQKSKKDVLLQALHYGLTGTAPQAESNILSKEEWSSINYICDMWFSLGDFDYAGIRFGIAHYVKYRIEPLFFVRKNTPLKTWITIGELRKLYLEFGKDVVRRILGRDTPEYFTAKDFSDNLEQLGIMGLAMVIKRYMDANGLHDDLIAEYYNNLLHRV